MCVSSPISQQVRRALSVLLIAPAARQRLSWLGSLQGVGLEDLRFLVVRAKVKYSTVFAAVIVFANSMPSVGLFALPELRLPLSSWENAYLPYMNLQLQSEVGVL